MSSRPRTPANFDNSSYSTPTKIEYQHKTFGYNKREMPTFRGQRSVTGLANWFDTGAKAPRRNAKTYKNKPIFKAKRSVTDLANWFNTGAKAPKRNAETYGNKPIFKTKRSVPDLAKQLSDVFVPRVNTGTPNNNNNIIVPQKQARFVSREPEATIREAVSGRSWFTL